MPTWHAGLVYIGCLKSAAYRSFPILHIHYIPAVDISVIPSTTGGDGTKDLFENYEDDFIITYLSQNLGFKDRKAALRFLKAVKQNEAISKSEQVYEQNYERLVDGALKSAFTRLHNATKKG